MDDVIIKSSDQTTVRSIMRKLICHICNTFIATIVMIAMTHTASANSATKWDMPTPYPIGIFHERNIEIFTKEVEKATNGALHIQIHANGSLFEHAEIKNAVRSRLAPIGEFILSRLSNENPVFEVDSIPFLATSFEDAERLWSAQQKPARDLLAKQGLTVLYSVPWPPQGIYTSKPLESINDLSGVKFRTYSSATEQFAKLAGAVPTQVEIPDIGQAFSTGRVGAMITSAATGVNTKAWDYLDYYYDTQAFLPKNVVVVNTSMFETLPESTQKIILDAAQKAESRGWRMAKQETKEMNQILENNGIKVIKPNAELSSSLKEIGDQMTKAWTKRAGSVGQNIIKKYQ
jgi:TRAP-type C4-dicarboxylate transport system substrate-binding protein